MIIHSKFQIGWLLFTVPFVATLNISVAPSRAATFGSATTHVNLTNFSVNAKSSLVSVDTATLAISPLRLIFDSNALDGIVGEYPSINAEPADGAVVATADISTFAFFPPAVSGTWSTGAWSSSETDNEAFGTGGSYLGQSQTESTVLANFFLNPESGETQTFSFDFNVFWELESLATKIPNEITTASADVSLVVCGRTSLDENPLFCDSLSTFGKIQSPDAIDAFAFKKSDAFSVDVLSAQFVSIDPTLNLKQAEFFALGYYQREFEMPIYLTLAEVQNSKVYVKAPEPSATVALLSLSVITVALGKRKKGTPT